MDVLFPLDVPTFSPGNPYVFHLMESLIHQPEISNVGSGWAALYWPKPTWDVVHIQWPEALVGWKVPKPTQIETLQSALQRARRSACIVVTVHNYNVQDRMGAVGQQLYETVYRNADAFVHLGRSSLEWFVATNNRREDTMLRFGLALFLCCTALQAQAAGDELAACLDPSTTILAGGDVSDKELAAAQSACARLKQTTQDEKLLKRIDAAASTLASEAQRRGKH